MLDIVLLDDRVSIKALLNGGVDTFTESFNLPPSDDRLRSLEVHQRKDEQEEQSASALNSPSEKDANAIDYLSVFESPIGLDDQYLDFWTGPFGLIPSPSYSSSDTQIDLYNPSIFNIDGQTDRTSLDPSPGQPEQANHASSLNLAIYNKLWCLALEPRSRQELTTYANFLLTTEKITKFTNLYFRNWHLNCPMLHRPSFDPAEVPLSLLVSVVFIGALYSKNRSERFAAQKLIDVAELVVFDSEIFSLEMEASHVLQHESVSYAGPGGHDWTPFQELQAGFLMVIAQYWAGARIAKGRAMESRFSDVIKVVRKLRLHQARHTPSDRISETAWLQKESRIRTMSVIALLDCAMRIYTNHPCRLILVELGSDLPCKESIFSSEHPFMEDGNIFAPRLTISKAFALLFQGKVKRSLSIVKKSSEEPESEESPPSASLGDLTKFDLFILIHFLYTYILGYVMTLSFNLPTTSFAPDGGRLARGAMTADTREALAQWRISWDRACAQTTGQPPRLAGMFRNAFYFWLVARSIINKEESIDVITNMEVNCDDALTKLKVLFQNDVD
ncbi:hypothetical protein LTR84_009225 [Exophiala bonariae]|uniref:Xylanolytic transcriptional activator regulatory domain-containing protein n=1 Tax=Exophiala bonariae TaxID=1690606 RepID=A0AAV9MUT0_9EURO|nr:hypothetical protein LTR84_009225 [Exophiala bonariae]